MIHDAVIHRGNLPGNHFHLRVANGDAMLVEYAILVGLDEVNFRWNWSSVNESAWRCMERSKSLTKSAAAGNFFPPSCIFLKSCSRAKCTAEPKASDSCLAVGTRSTYLK